MTPIYDINTGDLIGYYDDSMLAYDVTGNPIISNGAQMLYDPTTYQFIDASTIGGSVNNYGTTGTTSGTVDQNAPPSNVDAQSWIDLFTQAAPKIAAGISAFQLSQINIQRAQKGLAPLNPAVYAPQVGVGLTPATQQLVTFGLIGVGALMLFGGKKRKGG